MHGSQKHQASYSKPSGASYSEGGAAGPEADCSHRSNAELKIRGAIHPLSTCLHGMQRDNFTFTLYTYA